MGQVIFSRVLRDSSILTLGETGEQIGPRSPGRCWQNASSPVPLPAPSCLGGLLTSFPLPCPAFHVPASLRGPPSSSPFPLSGSRGFWEDLLSGQTGSSQVPMWLWGGDSEPWAVGTCWGPETCMGKWCLKTLAADSSSCRGLTHLPPTLADLQRTSQPISEKKTRL